MNDSPTNDVVTPPGADNAFPQATQKPVRERFPVWFWVLPGAVLLLVTVVVILSWTQRGPRIVVSFKEAHGLKAGDALRCRGTTVGEVRSVELARDMQGVEVVIDLRPRDEALAVEDSLFWIVRPQAALTGVSGLDTVVGAKYVAVLPGKGQRQRSFSGREEVPPESLDPEGLKIVLTGKRLGNIRPGVPLIHHQVRVGSVWTRPISTREGGIEVGVYVFPEYVELVRANSVFWNVSGFKLNAGLTAGLTLTAESVETVLAGGIAMDTPGKPGPRVSQEHRFVLAEEAPKERGEAIEVRFKESHGLKPGDLLRHRGLTLGEVRSVELAPDLHGVDVVIDLHTTARGIAVEGSQFWIVRPHADLTGVSGLDTVVGGKYVGVRPGQGAAQRKFAGLDDAPVLEMLEPGGLDIVLLGKRMGGLRPGVSLTYRQVEIGRVLTAQLSKDATAVEVHIHVRPLYTRLIRANSQFWNVSGIRFKGGLSGFSISAEPAQTVLAGGVAMATPEAPGKIVQNGATFRLEEEPPKDVDKWSPALPLVNLRLPGNKKLPRLVRATLQYHTHRNLFGKNLEEHRGLLLPVGNAWLLGPDDLLSVPANALGGQGTLTLEGESLAIADEKSSDSKTMLHVRSVKIANQRLGKKLADSLPVARLELAKELVDCWLVADAASPPRLIPKARLKQDSNGWKLDGADLPDARWHGAAVLSGESGDVIGVLSVSEKHKGVILPLTKDVVDKLS